MDLSKLKDPFLPTDINWRIGQAGIKNGEPWAKVLAYLDNRAIMDRLDEVVGPANWRNEYQPGPGGGVLCGISLRINDEWIAKWDGAENTEIESVKGGLSDSMKRAAVQWGIGRYLYEIGESWAKFIDKKAPGSYCSKIGEKGKEEWCHWLPPDLPRPFVPSAAPKDQPEDDYKRRLVMFSAQIRSGGVADLDAYVKRINESTELKPADKKDLLECVAVRREQIEKVNDRIG